MRRPDLLPHVNVGLPNDKGCEGGKCNRTACLNRPAMCYSSVERAFYCVPCARRINKYLPPGVAPITLKGGAP